MPTALERRFLAFMGNVPGAESLDELLAGEAYRGQRRADYLLFGRRAIFEVKSLEVDPSEKVEAEMAHHRDRTDFPLIYGEVGLDKVLRHLPDGKEINDKIYLHVTRSVDAAARSAEDQIENTARLLHLDRSIGVLVLLNQNVDILTPEAVAYRLAMLLKRKNDDGSFRTPIAYCWVLFESHSLRDGPATTTLPMLALRGPSAKKNQWFEEPFAYLQTAWASYNGYPLFRLPANSSVDLAARAMSEPPDPKPGDRIPRQKVWEHRYKVQPHLRGLSDEEVLRYGKRAVDALKPHHLKGGPKTTEEQWEILMIPWSDFLCEARHRGLDLRRLRDA